MECGCQMVVSNVGVGAQVPQCPQGVCMLHSRVLLWAQTKCQVHLKLVAILAGFILDVE